MSELKTVDDYTTYSVAIKWFDAMRVQDREVLIGCLDENIEWINYTKIEGMNDCMPWIGTYHGIEAVMQSFKVYLSVAEVKSEELISLIVSGEDATGIVREIATIKETQEDFEVEFVQWLKIQSGKIVRWKSYTDPSPIIKAMQSEKLLIVDGV